MKMSISDRTPAHLPSGAERVTFRNEHTSTRTNGGRKCKPCQHRRIHTPINALFFVELAPCACVYATVGAVIAIIVGAIVSALVGAVVATTLMTIHNPTIVRASQLKNRMSSSRRCRSRHDAFNSCRLERPCTDACRAQMGQPPDKSNFLCQSQVTAFSRTRSFSAR